jgi:hypothetical protein
LALGLAGNWKEQLELWGKLVLGVESVWEVDTTNTAVSVDLDSQSFDIVGTVSSTREIRQVKLNLIPALIKSHRHRANERLHSGGALVVWSSESSANPLVIKHLDFEGEVFLKLLPQTKKVRIWIKRRPLFMKIKRHKLALGNLR